MYIDCFEIKILIDALFNDSSITFCDIPSDENLNLMERSLAPFDAIDLILVTHPHRDHFTPTCVINA